MHVNVDTTIRRTRCALHVNHGQSVLGPVGIFTQRAPEILPSLRIGPNGVCAVHSRAREETIFWFPPALPDLETYLTGKQHIPLAQRNPVCQGPHCELQRYTTCDTTFFKAKRG